MSDTTAMSEERFKSLVEAYGSEPARWPAAEREAALRLMQASSKARAAVELARELDVKLGAAGAVQVPVALTNRLLADFARASQRWTARRLVTSLADAVWPGAPLWQPAVAFGLALAIGVGIAALAPLELRPTDDPSGAFAFDTVPGGDAGQDI
jgi:hypothetical protein